MAKGISAEDIAVQRAPKFDDSFEHRLWRELRLRAMARPETLPEDIDVRFEYQKRLFRFFRDLPQYQKKNGNPHISSIQSVINRRFEIPLRDVKSVIDAVLKEDKQEATPRIHYRARRGANSTKALIKSHRLASQCKKRVTP